jgi:predicted acyltransferase
MRYIQVPPSLKTERILSVDGLRGFDMLWILGGDGAMWTLDDMMRQKGPILSAIGSFLGTQLHHSSWEGFRFYDLLFPLFIFLTGVAIVLSLTRIVEREGTRNAHLRVLRRAMLLYGLGVIYYGGISEHWADVRLMGVLQRIGLCYLFAALMFLNFNWRGLLAALGLLLVGYWALMTFVPIPGIGPSSSSPDTNLANWIDAHYLPGRLWEETRDPEGLLSTLPAIASCLLGVFAGLLLKDGRIAPQQKSLPLIGAGIVLLAAGYLWSIQFPIIKQIWTSSFVLVAGGYSAVLLGVSYQIIDVWGYKGWATIFVWVGANAITLYFLNGMISFEAFAARFVGGDFAAFLDRTLTAGAGSFVRYMLSLVFAIALAGFLYRRQIFLRV